MPRVYSLAALGLLCAAVVVGCGKKDEGSGGGGGGPPDGSPMLRSRTEDDKKVAAERLRAVGKAMHDFHDANFFFPAGFVAQKGQLGLSWRVAILPYLGEGDLFKEFKLDQPWDGEHNKKLIARMPQVFEAPGAVISNGRTYLRSFIGQSALIQGGPVGVAPPKGPAPTFYPWANQPPGSVARGRGIAGITDGTSNTLMAVEAAEAVEWTKPDELPFNDPPGAAAGAPLSPLPKLGFPHEGGFFGLMCDGSVHFFPDAIGEKSLRALITAAGGEVNGPEVAPILYPPKTGGPPAPAPVPGVKTEDVLDKNGKVIGKKTTYK